MKLVSSQARADPPAVVSVEMGYGHLRAALPLTEVFGAPLLHADQAPLADAEEQRLWRWVRSGHELLSRPSQLSAVLGEPTRWMERVTRIPPLYLNQDLSKPTVATRTLDWLAARGLGRGLVAHLERTQVPLVTTFYVPAIIADRAGCEVYCVVTDADVNRVWAPSPQTKSRLRYFAPSLRVIRRLEAYGVPRERITMTGFPLPPELLGGPELPVLRQHLRARLVRLDPTGRFRELHCNDLERELGSLPLEQEGKAVHLTFAVGGAGAQADMAQAFLPSLRAPIETGTLKLTLAAGTRPDVADIFERAVVRTGMRGELGQSVRILREDDFESYYREFNRILAESDVLWTKPSELSFYAGLGIALVLAKPVGSHERFNRRWLREQGVALKQHNPRHAAHWLDEWIKDGTLAAAAWTGFVRLPKDGTYRIKAAVLGASAPVI